VILPFVFIFPSSSEVVVKNDKKRRYDGKNEFPFSYFSQPSGNYSFVRFVWFRMEMPQTTGTGEIDDFTVYTLFNHFNLCFAFCLFEIHFKTNPVAYIEKYFRGVLIWTE